MNFIKIPLFVLFFIAFSWFSQWLLLGPHGATSKALDAASDSGLYAPVIDYCSFIFIRNNKCRDNDTFICQGTGYRNNTKKDITICNGLVISNTLIKETIHVDYREDNLNEKNNLYLRSLR